MHLDRMPGTCRRKLRRTMSCTLTLLGLRWQVAAGQTMGEANMDSGWGDGLAECTPLLSSFSSQISNSFIFAFSLDVRMRIYTLWRLYTNRYVTSRVRPRTCAEASVGEKSGFRSRHTVVCLRECQLLMLNLNRLISGHEQQFRNVCLLI